MARLTFTCGLLLAVAVVLTPAVMALVTALSGDFSSLELTLTPRRRDLLLRGWRLAAVGAGLAQVLGALLAAGWLARRPAWLFGATTWLALATVLMPTYILAYALSLPVLPDGLVVAGFQERPWFWWLATEGRALLGMTIWQAPLAAFVLALGWHRRGAAAARLASLDASFPRAVLWAALPAMLPWVAVSWLLTSAMLLGEFALPHLSLVQTFNTELLAETQQHPGRALLLAWPLLVLIALPLLGGALLRPWLRRSSPVAGAAGLLGRGTLGWRVLAVVIAGVILLAPWVLLLGYLDDPAAWLRVGQVFPQRWLAAVQIGCVAAAIAVCIAVALEAVLNGPRRGAWRWLRGVAWVVAGLSALALFVPPVLVGDAILVTYGGQAWLADRFLIVGLVTALRFSLPAIAITVVAGRFVAMETADLAGVDRVGALEAWWRIRLVLLRPALLSVALLTGVLAISEVAASQLVTPPGVPSLAVTLLNQIHFGRNAEVVALCLQALLVVGVVSGLLVWALGRVTRRGS